MVEEKKYKSKYNEEYFRGLDKLVEKELVKYNFKEKGQVVYLVVKIGSEVLVDIELNCEVFETVSRRNETYLDKLRILQMEVSNDYSVLKSRYVS